MTAAWARRRAAALATSAPRAAASALGLVASLAACAPTTDVTLRLTPPDDDAVRQEIYQARPRCLVLAAAPIDNNDTVVRAVAVRTSRVAPSSQLPGAPRCLGGPGAVLLGGLRYRATYLLALVYYDEADFADGGPPADLERIVSVQDFPRSPEDRSTYVCLASPAANTRVYRAIVERARELCTGAIADGGVAEPCALDFDEGICDRDR